MQNLWQDLRYATRMLLKNPGFSLIAIVTLALGIGANTSMFSMLDALLLKPPPGVSDPASLVQIGQTSKGEGFSTSSYANYRDYCGQNTTLTGIVAESQQPFHLGTDKMAERVPGALVSGNYFEVFGVAPALGRLLQQEDADRARAVVVISESLWRKDFGGDPSAVGATVTLNSHSYTIVGVAKQFRGTSSILEKTDLWIPVTMWRHGNPWLVAIGADWLNNRGSQFVELFGRLKPGVTAAQAQADLDAISARLAQTYPETNSSVGERVEPGMGLFPSDRKKVRQLTGFQMGVVGITLLIACANIAGLLLARSASRRKEIAIRLAMGAGRWRIVRQMLTESTLLALLGGTLGALLALWSGDWLWAALPEQLNGSALAIEFGIDLRVLAFTFGLSLVTGVLFGLLPAMQSSRPDLIPALKDTGASSPGRRSRFRSVMVIGQVALSVLLLISAGLCLRTLHNSRGINVGFAHENVLTAKVDLGRQNYSEQQGRRFYQQLLERAGGLPGVRSANLALSVPLAGRSYGTSIDLDNGERFNIRFNFVTPGYHDMMGIPLLAGRRFSERDDANAPQVAIINESFARRAWPDENPIGKHFKWNDRDGRLTIEIVGVARDVRGSGLFDEMPRLAYLPFGQRYDGGMTLHLRLDTKPDAVIAALREEVAALDNRLPLYDVTTFEQFLNAALSQQRVQAQLSSIFGLLALVMASIGLYGVLSYGVSQRMREIGIRMALGAQGRDVLRMVVGDGMKLVATGLAVGFGGAFAATRTLQSLLYGVSATDPLTFALAALVLVVVGLLACFLPARRATRIDPMAALRCE